MAAAADAERLWSDLDAHERELRREGYQLREIWHKTTELHAENEKARSELEGKARQNFVAPDTRINLNVGGQLCGNQPVRRVQFFTKSFLGDGTAVLARSRNRHRHAIEQASRR